MSPERGGAERAGTLRHNDRVLARAVLLLLLALLSAAVASAPAEPPAELAFQVASAVARTGSARIGGTPEAAALLASPPGAPAEPQRIAPALPVERTVWPGETAVVLPLYLFGRALEELAPEFARAAATRAGGVSEPLAHLVAGLRGPACAALLGWLLVLAARRLGCSRRVSYVGALSFGLATFAAPSSRVAALELQLALALLGALYVWLRLREARGRGRGSAVDALGLGALLGLALASSPATAPAVGVLDLGLAAWLFGAPGALSRRRAARLAVLAAAPQLAALLVLALVGPARFVHAGPAAGPELDLGRAVVGLLASPGKGLPVHAPGVVLAVLGVARAAGSRRRLTMAVVTGMGLALALPACARADWAQGFSYGPRALLPALPFLWIGVALGLQTLAEARRGLRLAGAVLAAGVFTQLPGLLVDARTYRTLALEGGPLAVPEVDALPAAARERELAERLPFEPGFAAPLAHWRILRHRAAGLGEEFPLEEVFRLPVAARASPGAPRERGFRHLEWVDLHQRTGRGPWIVTAVLGLLLAFGVLLSVRSLDPTAP